MGIDVLVKICSSVIVGRLAEERTYSYVGDDHPEVWPIERPPVNMWFEESAHYDLDSSIAGLEWGSLAPGSGVVHLGEHQAPYSLSMMHQLGCLDVVRDAVVHGIRNDTTREKELVQHCLNYLRQTVLCRGDTFLEPFHYFTEDDADITYDIYQCNDWGAVYRAVQANQQLYYK
ncbi:hypothetical protein OBBRIDRAFT_798552 [Obba rivulosa]|uniref:Uncharacterized protein n=1 Tax=Obba rivulosa TaxID=1052685 RepID=A0A8E2DJT0_9APHY|nr:hypothetical protein OBBRIDRAFT_798552 [Obba rivulosa]